MTSSIWACTTSWRDQFATSSFRHSMPFASSYRTGQKNASSHTPPCFETIICPLRGIFQQETIFVRSDQRFVNRCGGECLVSPGKVNRSVQEWPWFFLARLLRGWPNPSLIRFGDLAELAIDERKLPPQRRTEPDGLAWIGFIFSQDRDRFPEFHEDSSTTAVSACVTVRHRQNPVAHQCL